MNAHGWSSLSSVLKTGDDDDVWLDQDETLNTLKAFVADARQQDDAPSLEGPVQHDEDAIDFYDVSDGDLSDEPDAAPGAKSDGESVRTSAEQVPSAPSVQQIQLPVADILAATSLPNQHQGQQQNQHAVQFAQPALSHPVQSSQAVQSFTELLGPASPAEPLLTQHPLAQAGLASVQTAVVQPGATYAPGIPPGLLYDQSQPDQVSEHRIFTLGPITLDQDEFAASITAHQTGIELPEAQQAQLFIEPISFTETFFGAGGYPRLCQTTRHPGVRQKQADRGAQAVEKPGDIVAATCLMRDGRLCQVSDVADLQWEHDVLDLAALPEPPAEVKPAAGKSNKAKPASARAAEAPVPSRPQVRQTVVQPVAPLSQDVMEVEDLWQEILAEEAEDITLFCRAAVPDWEKDVEWGSDDGLSQAGAVRSSDAASPVVEARAPAHGAIPIEWESDSDGSEHTEALQSSQAVRSAGGGQRAAGPTSAELYGWDNAREQGDRGVHIGGQSFVRKAETEGEGFGPDQHSESTDVTIDAPATDGAPAHTSAEATESLLFPGGKSAPGDTIKQRLLDEGLWTPAVSNGAAMPYYLKLPKSTSHEDGAEDMGIGEQPSSSSGREVQEVLRAAQRVDDSGLAPSFDWPEGKLAAGGLPPAARVSQLSRSGLVVLNANDRSMIFEVLPNVPEAEKTAVEAASAQVVAPPPLPKDAEATRLASAHEDKVAKEFAVFNVSNDAKYRKTRVGRLADIAVRTGLLHAPIATNLSQLPLPNTLTREELLQPHHPRYVWWIHRRMMSGDQGQIRVVFQSLPGLSRQVDLPAHSAGQVTVRQLWEMVESAFIPEGPTGSSLSLFKPGTPGGFDDVDISEAMDQSLVDVGLMEPVNEVIVRSRQVQLLSLPRALSSLPSQPTVLQALYGTRKKLTATQWHVYGVEHMLPGACVLNHPGMGATLQTFFRRPEGRDARARAAAETLAELTAVAEGPQAWRIGQVTPLGAQDASPFRIGDVDPGVPLLTMENGSSIAVAAPHVPGNNYLLVRRPSGHMLVRKFSGCFLVGQQQPKIPVMQPASQTCREVEDSRLVAYVHRTLRRKQNKLARENSFEERPSVSVKELVERFAPPCLSQYSGLDVNLTENAIISILQSRCHLVPSPNSTDEYVLPEGARIHTEDELCTMIGPDSVCALESMRSGLVRLDETGLRRHEDLAKCPLDKLALLAHMLPRRNENREAALAAVTAAVSAPWVLTENFINCTKKDTQKMFLCISGLGDPSGCGLAMSYVKDMKRLGKDPVNRMLSKQEAPSITGTVSDLRKLPHKQVGEMLVKEFNVDRETVETLDRWERIGVLRELSNQACVAGQANELGPRYARNVKVSMEEMRKKQSDAACAVLRRQHKFLTAGQMPEGTAEHDPSLPPAGQLDEQSREVLHMRPDGDEDEPGQTNGQMRIRRRITYARPGRGQPVSRTIYFTTRTDIFNINSLCEKWDQRNEKLGIVGGTLSRTMDGVRKQLTIACVKKGSGEVERRTCRFKSRKPTVRTRAPAARPAPPPRVVRAPGAATKAEMRKQQQEEAAALAAAQQKSKPKGEGKSKPKSKPKPKDTAKAKKKPEKDDEETEDEEFEVPELSDAEPDPAGLAVVDERDPEFVEYQEQYDESNSDVPDGGSDSDYNSIDSGAESEDKDFKAAAQREIRAQQRAKAGPSAAGPKASGGGRRQKRAPKGAPKESEFDEEEAGELEDLIDDGDLDEPPPSESEDDFSSGGDEETEDEFEDNARPKAAAKRAPRKPVKRQTLADDDDDSTDVVPSTPARGQRATADSAPTPVTDSPAPAPASKIRVKIKRQGAGGSKKKAAAAAARPRPVKRTRALSESTESDEDDGDVQSTESDAEELGGGGRGKRRKVVDSPPPEEAPEEPAALQYAAPAPDPALQIDVSLHAARELQLRQRAPEFKSAAIRELSTLLTSALNEAFSSNNELQLVQNVFKAPPSTLNIPDYYEIIDRRDVITWPSLKKRQHTSRKALLADLGRMTHNAAVYNVGALVRNPDYTPGGTEPEFVKRGPGKHGLPAVVPLMKTLQKRVGELLEGKYRYQAEKLELKILGAYLVVLEYDQGANVLWVECEKCQKWRIVSRETFERVQDARFTCDDPGGRPLRGCKEGANSMDDEELLRIAKQDLLPL